MLWRMRNHLGEFRGAYVSKATKTEVERGTPGAEFVRHSSVCALGDVEMWLTKLPRTIFFVDMAEWQTPALLEILGKYPLLTRNK